MAQLKDTIVSGSLRATDTLYSTTAQFQILRAPTTSSGTSYTTGAANNLIKSNGSSIYWATLSASDIPSLGADKITSGTLGIARGGTGNNTFTAHNLIWAETATKLSSAAYAHLNYTAGTTSVIGQEQIVFGNNIASGTANNAQGLIALYSSNTAGSYIKAASTASWVTHTLPATTGWLVVAGNGSNSGAGGTYSPIYVSTTGIATSCTSPSILTNLGSTTAANVFAQSPRPGVTGTLPIANGGTGATDASGARTNLGAAASSRFGTAEFDFSATGSWGGVNQHWGIGGVVQSTTQGTKTYLGKKTFLVPCDDGMFLWNATDNTFIWNLNIPISPLQGGTGQTSLKNSANSLLSNLDTATTDMISTAYIITSDALDPSTNLFYRRPASAIVNSTLVKAALGTDSYSGLWPNLSFGTLEQNGSYIASTGTWGRLYYYCPGTRSSDSYKYPSHHFSFRQFSAPNNNVQGPTPLGYWEQFNLPDTTIGRESNAEYKILTTKNITTTTITRTPVNGNVSLGITFNDYIVLNVYDPTGNNYIWIPFKPATNYDDWWAHGITNTSTYSVVSGSNISICVTYIPRL